ncbi:MAG: energy transducer TonB [Woeseiaceae bacterium]
MTQPKEYSSVPIVIVISSVILASAASGWFFFREDVPAQTSGSDESAPIQLASLAGPAMIAASQFDIDADLRKARLAADADLIASPPKRNALYYYARVLKADSEHRLAIAEMAAVLARASQTVNDQLAADNYEDAYVLAARVSAHRFEHPTVDSIRKALTDYATEMLIQARESAEAGDDTQAAAVLAELEQLSGLSEKFVASARKSVVDIQQAHTEARQDKLEEAQKADDQEASDWALKVRDAVESGWLIEPEGESARDYLMARETPTETKKQLTEEVVVALASASSQSLESGDLATAESYLGFADDLSADAIATLGSDSATLLALLDSVESELIAAEGKRVLKLSDFTQVSTEPARYPASAQRRNITGWVEVMFTVTAIGETANIEVVRAKPKNFFDGPAIEAVEKWTFQPREYRGQPISQRTAARLVFDLE